MATQPQKLPENKEYIDNNGVASGTSKSIRSFAQPVDFSTFPTGPAMTYGGVEKPVLNYSSGGTYKPKLDEKNQVMTNFPLTPEEQKMIRPVDTTSLSGQAGFPTNVSPIDATKLETKTMSPILGGGQRIYDPAQPGAIIRTDSDRIYNQQATQETLSQTSGWTEMDHIMPLWLGGQDIPSNLEKLNIVDHDKKTKIHNVINLLYRNIDNKTGKPYLDSTQAKMLALSWRTLDFNLLKNENFVQGFLNGDDATGKALSIVKQWQDPNTPKAGAKTLWENFYSSFGDSAQKVAGLDWKSAIKTTDELAPSFLAKPIDAVIKEIGENVIDPIFENAGAKESNTAFNKGLIAAPYEPNKNLPGVVQAIGYGEYLLGTTISFMLPSAKGLTVTQVLNNVSNTTRSLIGGSKFLSKLVGLKSVAGTAGGILTAAEEAAKIAALKTAGGNILKTAAIDTIDPMAAKVASNLAMRAFFKQAVEFGAQEVAIDTLNDFYTANDDVNVGQKMLKFAEGAALGGIYGAAASNKNMVKSTSAMFGIPFSMTLFQTGDLKKALLDGSQMAVLHILGSEKLQRGGWFGEYGLSRNVLPSSPITRYHEVVDATLRGLNIKQSKIAREHLEGVVDSSLIKKPTGKQTEADVIYTNEELDSIRQDLTVKLGESIRKVASTGSMDYDHIKKEILRNKIAFETLAMNGQPQAVKDRVIDLRLKQAQDEIMNDTKKNISDISNSDAFKNGSPDFEPVVPIEDGLNNTGETIGNGYLAPAITEAIETAKANTIKFQEAYSKGDVVGTYLYKVKGGQVSELLNLLEAQRQSDLKESENPDLTQAQRDLKKPSRETPYDDTDTMIYISSKVNVRDAQGNLVKDANGNNVTEYISHGVIGSDHSYNKGSSERKGGLNKWFLELGKHEMTVTDADVIKRMNEDGTDIMRVDLVPQDMATKNAAITLDGHYQLIFKMDSRHIKHATEWKNNTDKKILTEKVVTDAPKIADAVLQSEGKRRGRPRKVKIAPPDAQGEVPKTETPQTSTPEQTLAVEAPGASQKASKIAPKKTNEDLFNEELDRMTIEETKTTPTENTNLEFSKTKEGKVQGAYDPSTDKIILVTENIKPGEERKVMYHEVTTRGMFRAAADLGGINKLHDVLSGAKTELIKAVPELLERTGHKTIEELAKTYDYDLSTPEGNAKLLMELTARWGEKFSNKPPEKWYERLIGGIKDWVREFMGKDLSERQVDRLVAGFFDKGNQDATKKTKNALAKMFSKEGISVKETTKETPRTVMNTLELLRRRDEIAQELNADEVLTSEGMKKVLGKSEIDIYGEDNAISGRDVMGELDGVKNIARKIVDTEMEKLPDTPEGRAKAKDLAVFRDKWTKNGIKRLAEKTLEDSDLNETKGFELFIKRIGNTYKQKGLDANLGAKGVYQGYKRLFQTSINNKPTEHLIYKTNAKGVGSFEKAPGVDKPLSHIEKIIGGRILEHQDNLDVPSWKRSPVEDKIDRTTGELLQKGIVTGMKEKGYLPIVTGDKVIGIPITPLISKGKKVLGEGASGGAVNKYMTDFLKSLGINPKKAYAEDVNKRIAVMNSKEIDNPVKGETYNVLTLKDSMPISAMVSPIQWLKAKVNKVVGDVTGIKTEWGKASGENGQAFMSPEAIYDIAVGQGRLDADRVKYLKPTQFFKTPEGQLFLQKLSMQAWTPEIKTMLEGRLGRKLGKNDIVTFKDNVKMGYGTGKDMGSHFELATPSESLKIEYSHPHTREASLSPSLLASVKDPTGKIAADMRKLYEPMAKTLIDIRNDFNKGGEKFNADAIWKKYPELKKEEWSKELYGTISKAAKNGAGPHHLRLIFNTILNKKIESYMSGKGIIKGDNLKATIGYGVKMGEVDISKDTFIHLYGKPAYEEYLKGKEFHGMAVRYPSTTESTIAKYKLNIKNDIGDRISMNPADVYKSNGDYDGDSFQIFGIGGKEGVPESLAEYFTNAQSKGETIMKGLTKAPKTLLEGKDILTEINKVGIKNYESKQGVSSTATMKRIGNNLVGNKVKFILNTEAESGKSGFRRLDMYENGKLSSSKFLPTKKKSGKDHFSSSGKQEIEAVYNDDVAYTLDQTSQESIDAAGNIDYDKRLTDHQKKTGAYEKDINDYIYSLVFPKAKDWAVKQTINEMIQPYQKIFKSEESISNPDGTLSEVDLLNNIATINNMNKIKRFSGGRIGVEGEVLMGLKDIKPIGETRKGVTKEIKDEMTAVDSSDQMEWRNLGAQAVSDSFAATGEKMMSNPPEIFGEILNYIKESKAKPENQKNDKEGNLTGYPDFTKVKNDVEEFYSLKEPELSKADRKAVSILASTNDDMNASGKFKEKTKFFVPFLGMINSNDAVAKIYHKAENRHVSPSFK